MNLFRTRVVVEGILAAFLVAGGGWWFFFAPTEKSRMQNEERNPSPFGDSLYERGKKAKTESLAAGIGDTDKDGLLDWEERLR